MLHTPTTLSPRPRVLGVVLFAALVLLPTQLLRGQYRFESWTTENGLPQNTIWAMRQTRDGYLWMTTDSSLVRFDGLRFREFNRRDTPGLAADGFVAYALWEDRQGCLWAGTQTAGVVRYCNGVFETFTARDGLGSNTVIRIDEDGEGGLWLFTDPGVTRWKDGRFTRIAPTPGSPLNEYLTAPRIRIGFDGYRFGLWKIEKSGWQRFSHGRWSAFPLPAGTADATAISISSIVEDSKGRLWYRFRHDPSTYYCLDNGRLSTFAGSPRESFVSYQDGRGYLWGSSHEGRATLLKNGAVTPLERFKTPYVFRAVEDGEHSVWLGTRNSGLYRASPTVITTFPPSNAASPELNVIATVLEGRDGSIWYGSNGLFQWTGKSLRGYYRKGAAPLLNNAAGVRAADNMVSALYQDQDGTIWAGTWDGVARLRGSHLVAEGPTAQIRGRINSIHRDRAGVLWIGAAGGLYRVEGETVTHLGREHGIGRHNVSVIHEGPTGALRIGTSAGLYVRTEEGFRRPVATQGQNAQSLDQQEITALHEDEAGILWAGTASFGLYRLENGKLTHFREEHGLSTPSVLQILEDGSHSLWLGSHTGIHRVKKAELNAIAAGQGTTVASTAFGKTDGMNSAACSPFGQPGAVRANDGRLLFATDDGIAMLHPAAARINVRPPPVRVEQFAIDGHAVEDRTSATLRPGQLSLDIQYTALSFTKSSQLRFRYRMEGLDAEWIEAGTRRTAYYTRVPPGDYTFRVIAANSDGVWNNEGAALAVHVLPAFYQTTWFQFAVVLAVAAMIATTWRVRVAQWERRQALQQAFSSQLIASQEEERKRIAAELHDSIGQRLVIVKNLALFFLRAQGEDGAVNPKLRSIEEIAAEAALAINETREIAYNLRPFQLDRLGLTKAIEGIVRTAAAASSIQFRFDSDNIDDAIAEELRINFYRIAQESVNNVMKHAEATEVEVRVQRTGNQVLLLVRDNGKGFTPAPGAGTAKSDRTGFGIAGMVERARSLGARLHVQSAPGQGTSISLHVPVAEKRA